MLDRSPSVGRPPRLRSRITNGKSLFADTDARSGWARRFQDLVELHTDDLGGRSSLSEAQLSLVRRAATLEVELEKAESSLAGGGQVDLDAYARVANALRRIWQSLGLKRHAKDVTPNLTDIVARHRESDKPREATE